MTIAHSQARYQFFSIPFLLINILFVLENNIFVTSISINLGPARRLWWSLSPGPRPLVGANAPLYQKLLIWLVWG